MPTSILEIGARFDLGNVPSAAAQAGTSIRGIGAAAESIIPKTRAAAAEQAYMAAVMEETERRFSSSRHKEEEVDRAWIEALKENSERAKKEVEEYAEKVEAAARRAEHAREHEMEQLKEFGLIAAKALRTGTVTGVLGAFGEVAGIAAGVGLLEHYVDQVKEIAIETEHLAKYSGIAASELAALKQAAAASGAPLEGLTTSVRRYSMSSMEAAHGSKEVKEAFDQLHITVGSKLLDAFEQLGRHLQTSHDRIGDTAAMTRLFGRDTEHLYTFLQGAGAGLKELVAQHMDYGKAIEASGPPALELEKIEVSLKEQILLLASYALPLLNTALIAGIDAWIRTKVGVTAASEAISAFVQTSAIGLESLGRTSVLVSEMLAHPIDAALGKFSKRAEEVGNANDAAGGKINAIWTKVGDDIDKAAEAGRRQLEELHRAAAEHGPEGEDKYTGSGINAKAIDLQEEQLSGLEKHILAGVELQRLAIEQKEKLDGGYSAGAVAGLKELNAKELSIHSQFIDAKIALYKNDPDSAEKVAKLRAEKLEVIDKSVKEELTLQFKGQEEARAAALKYQEEVMKGWERNHAYEQKSAAEAWAENRKIEEERLNFEVQLQHAIQKVSEDRAKAEAVTEETAGTIMLDRLKAEKEATVKWQEAHDVGVNSRIATIKAYDKEILKLIDDETDLKIAALGPNPTEEQKAKVTGEGEKQKSGVGIEETKEIAAAWKSVEDEIKSVLTSITGSVQSATKKWIEDGGSFAKNFRKVPAEMLASFVDACEKMVFKWISAHITMASVQAAWHSISIGMAVAYHAIMEWLDFKARLSSAKTAAANTYKVVSEIPVVGPFIAPPAAAAAYAAVLAFKEGGIVGGDAVMAQLHPREMVLPANVTQHVLNSMGDGGKGGGGETHLHYHAHPNQDSESMKADARTMFKHMEREMRRRNLSPSWGS